MNFWQKLPQPILGLAPMDGVTDAAFRYITAKYGKPDVIFTEFVSIDGLAHSVPRLLRDFLYSEIERPIVAQIYGNDPKIFYEIAIMVCELGFDGLDINMGCPAKSVAARGCGAGLIRTPELAKTIIRTCKQGITDWVNGKSLRTLSFKPKMLAALDEMKSEHPLSTTRKAIPVSLKTRIGYDKVIIADWVQHLLEAEPVAISIHGRTLKQMYQGQADWEAIAQAAEIIKKTSTLALGNGDIQTLDEAKKRILETGVHGVLLGRSVMGNPWIFNRSNPELNPQTIFEVLLDHAKYYEQVRGKDRFFEMRKHMGWYARGFPFAKELRSKLFISNTSQEVEQIVASFL